MNDAAPPAVKSLPVVADNGEFSMLMDTSKFAQLQRVGTMYAHSKMVPAHFQGDEASCMVAVQMAMRLNIDPFMFLQKTYVVSGKPGMEAPLVIALINTRGPFVGPIDWNVTRDDKGEVISCTAFATHKATGRVCSAEVTWKMVEAEGWSKKGGSKWLTLREQMFKYRSAAFLGRLYCPEVLMGMSTAEELEDSRPEVDVTPAPRAEPAPAKPRLRAAMGIPAEQVVEPEEDRYKDRKVEAVDYTTGEIKVSAADTEKALAEGRATRTEAESGGTVGPTSGNPEPKPFGAPREPREPAPAPEGQPAVRDAGKAPEGAAVMPFDELLKYAKKAKNAEQANIVLDQARHASYTDVQRAEVKAVLDAKKFEG